MQKPLPKPVDPVEQFYQTYDKPPRAFVEFQLNPTPANAMAWVQEYQSIINRSSQTAEAWRQAETAFNQYQQTGQLPPEFAQALTDEERQQVMNIVQTGGVKPYNFSDNSPASSLPQTFQNAVRGVPNQPAANPPEKPKADALAALNRGSRTTPEVAEPTRLSLAALNRGEDTSDSDVIRVNYYFSAVCPFCRRFEPEFAQVQQQFNAKRLDVTCVDMTPGERVPTNKQGAVDCKWRPLAAGEKDANQVRATPSLLIDFGPTKSLELVEGFVESDQLLSYLNKKVAE
jgi:thiol-disulfide isomerase/thioredoxin